ncbi:MAG: glycosyltransferase family 4 protein [Candidatus Didemnitutus sp.]|nr:glycosyltransferase family 4 protein [Candidatus Didemnitutus sp.]
MSAPRPLGEVESPRPLRAPGGHLAGSGWCIFSGVDPAPEIRMRFGEFTLATSGGLPRPDVAQLLPGEPAAAHSGFTFAGAVPAGTHIAVFEARAGDGTWHLFKQLTLAADSPPFAAVIDTPISSGTLRDRVKVAGWALDRQSPVVEVKLRYGHREIDCAINQPRTDVPQLFPDAPHAAHAGFVTDDFLVAGHGPVRVRARLADGRTVVASTTVSFSVATDENHAADLDLTAARVPLPGYAPPRPRPPVAPSPHALNLLFLLPGSFASNNAIHAASLANELAAAGHRCAIAVAHDVATLAHHATPAFTALTHAEAPAHRFADGRPADVVHAWTTRELVRRATLATLAAQPARLVVHLEDNEQQILAHTLGRDFAEVRALDDAELDRLVPADLSHPHRSREFLAHADGVTVIAEKLRAFVPLGAPCHTLWPAADARYFFPRPRPEEFRRALQLPPDATVLFYHGNVHAANAAEMRELYAAVTELNESGAPATLIRTGLDTVDFLGADAERARRHVLELGQILHHRHLAPLMALADFFVQPGSPDAFNDYRFPSKLPEFFALGRPVILPRTNLGSLVRHGVDAFVLERADAAGIAGAVRELRADPTLAARLATGAAHFAAEHFSWTRSAEALAKFYASLATSGA